MINRNVIILILLVLFVLACQQPLGDPPEDTTDETEEPADEELNVAPVVKINEGDQVLQNGTDAVFTPLIIDPDDDEHTVTWYVDDTEFIKQNNCCFSASPDIETAYTVSVTVSDGEAEDRDSVTVTVQKPVWKPESRYIYLYSESAEPDGTNYEKLYIAGPDTDYYWLYNAAKMKMESHNRDYPDDPWIIIGGGP